jgi:hypothetical protein
MLMGQYYGAALQDESKKRDTGEEKEEEELLKVRSYIALLNFCIGHVTESFKYSFLCRVEHEKKCVYWKRPRCEPCKKLSAIFLNA